MTSSRISGELYHVTDYTGFSGDPALQEGHYVALKFEATEDATVTIELFGDGINRTPKELDSDMNLVLRVTNPAVQKLKVTVSKTDYEDLVKVYHLSGLKLLNEEAPVDAEDDNNV